MDISRPFSDWLVQRLHHLEWHIARFELGCLLNTPECRFLIFELS